MRGSAGDGAAAFHCPIAILDQATRGSLQPGLRHLGQAPTVDALALEIVIGQRRHTKADREMSDLDRLAAELVGQPERPVAQQEQRLVDIDFRALRHGLAARRQILSTAPARCHDLDSDDHRRQVSAD